MSVLGHWKSRHNRRMSSYFKRKCQCGAFSLPEDLYGCFSWKQMSQVLPTNPCCRATLYLPSVVFWRKNVSVTMAHHHITTMMWEIFWIFTFLLDGHGTSSSTNCGVLWRTLQYLRHKTVFAASPLKKVQEVFWSVTHHYQQYTDGGRHFEHLRQ